jgi:hypothetical protein
MEQDVDLKEIERKAYLSDSKDGFWDLCLGFFFLSQGIAFAVHWLAYAGILGAAVAVLLPTFMSLKRAIALPRLGYVKFSPERQAKLKKGRLLLIMVLTFTALLGVVVSLAYTGQTGWNLWLRNLHLIPYGFVLAVVAGAVGFLFDIKRFLYYAVLILAAFIIGRLMNAKPDMCFIPLGAVFFVFGLVLMIRFLRKYPKPARKTANDRI